MADAILLALSGIACRVMAGGVRLGLSKHAYQAQRKRVAQTMDELVAALPKSERRSRPTWARRFLRGTIHFLSYHLIYNQRRTRTTRAAGFQFLIPPTVFHPRWFLSSEFFAAYIAELDLAGKCVADIGTGSGILALAAARAGAGRVVAVDINPNAALAAAENAQRNGAADKVSALCSDLFAALAPQPIFDVILTNPPFFPGKPRDLADRAWFAGPEYRDIVALFDQAGERLRPGGRLYVILSSDSDLAFMRALASRAGLDARVVRERWILVESLIIYECMRRGA